MELRQNFEKNKQRVQLIFLTLVVILTTWVYFTYLHHYFTLATIKHYKDFFYEQTQLHPVIARATYSISYFILTCAFLPVAALFNLLAGFLFGTVEGVITVTLITALSAIVNLLTVRYLLRSPLARIYKKSFEKFDTAFQEHGINYLLFIRLSGLFPFPVANILLGLTDVSIATYTWTTTIGMIPGSIFFVYMGNKLGSLNSIKDVLNWQLLFIFAGTSLLALLPIVYKKYKAKHYGLS